MLKLGIKVGPKDWRDKFDRLGEKPNFVEVHYRLNKNREYQDLFQYLSTNKILAGLHIGALVDGRYLPSIATGSIDFTIKSKILINQLIEKVSENNFCYALFHIGQNRKCSFNFSSGQFHPENQSESGKNTILSIIDALGDINNFAKKQNILSVVEIECKCQYGYWRKDRKIIGNTQEFSGNDVSPDVFVKIINHHYPICLDIAHLSTWCDHREDRQNRFDQLIDYSKKMIEGVKVVHAASILPPYRCDSDSGFMADELASGVFPNIEELSEILEVFQKYPKEIMIVGEPRDGDHVETYWLLKEVIRNLNDKQKNKEINNEWKNVK